MVDNPPTNTHTPSTKVKVEGGVEEGEVEIKCNLDKARMYIIPPHNNIPNTKEGGEVITKGRARWKRVWW